MKKVSGIYKITNIHNGKFYIGSSKNIKKRISTHKTQLRKQAHPNIILQRAWNKYGESGFVFEIVEEVIPDLLLSVEQSYLDRLLPSYNISKATASTSNQNGFVSKKLGRVFTPEEREKYSKSMKELWKHERSRLMESILDPERIRSISNSTKERWSNNSLRNIHAKYWNEQNRAKASERHKVVWAQNRSKFILAFNSERAASRKSQSAKDFWKRPEYRANRKKSLVENFKNDPRRKITDKEIIWEIRRLYDSGELSQEKIAKQFGITRSGVQSIGLRKTWKWLDEKV